MFYLNFFSFLQEYYLLCLLRCVIIRRSYFIGDHPPASAIPGRPLQSPSFLVLCAWPSSLVPAVCGHPAALDYTLQSFPIPPTAPLTILAAMPSPLTSARAAAVYYI